MIKPYKKILQRLLHWHSLDNQWKRAFDNLSRTIAPGSYPPVVEPKFALAFMEGLQDGGPGGELSLQDWLSYWLYEVPSMQGPVKVTDQHGIEYDFKNKNDVAKFLIRNF